MRWPLREQILWPLAGLVATAFTAASLLNAWLAAQQVTTTVTQRLREALATLEAADFPLESAVLRQASGLTGAQFALADADGAFLAASRENVQPSAELATAAPRPPRELRLDHTVTLAGALQLASAVQLDRSPRGGKRYRLFVFYPQQTLRDAQRQALVPPLAVGLVTVLLVVVAARQVAGRVSRPVQRLTAQVQALAAGEASIAWPAPSEPSARDDEVRDLTQAVHELARRLALYEREVRAAERLQTLAQLGGGIAHQVRNAATGCRLALDLHRQGCTGANDSSEEEPLAIAAQQLDLIETHVQRLLALGKNPAAAASALREPVPLPQALASAAALVAPLARHLGVTLSLAEPPATLTPSLVTVGDAHDIQQLLLNLLTNAVQAAAAQQVLTGAAGQVQARWLAAAPQTIALDIGDNGAGPAPQIAERLFQPFATDKPGGTGLGLSVARRIAQAHGGDVTWRRADGWTWFRATLACSRPNA